MVRVHCKVILLDLSSLLFLYIWFLNLISLFNKSYHWHSPSLFLLKFKNSDYSLSSDMHHTKIVKGWRTISSQIKHSLVIYGELSTTLLTFSNGETWILVIEFKANFIINKLSTVWHFVFDKAVCCKFDVALLTLRN